MSKYLLEIKNRLFIIAFNWFFSILIAYKYKEVLLFIIIEPCVLYNSGRPTVTVLYFIFTDVTEIFSLYVQLVIFLCFQGTFFFAANHFFFFVNPALFKAEYFYISLFVGTGASLWIISTLLVSYTIVPLTWNFFLSFRPTVPAQSINLHFEAKLNEYLIFYMQLHYLFVCYLEFFAFSFLLLSYNKMNFCYIKKFRKLYFYVFVFFSTLLTPPDIISQLIVAFILIVLYECLTLLFLFKLSYINLIR